MARLKCFEGQEHPYKGNLMRSYGKPEVIRTLEQERKSLGDSEVKQAA